MGCAAETRFWITLGSLALAACGGESTGADADAAVESSDAGGGEGSTVEVGSRDDGPCGLGMAVPEHGFQVCTKGVQIEPMQDVEYCEVVTLPGSPSDTYYVSRVETRMSPNSHHLIILAADPGSTNEADMPDGRRVNCVGGEQAFGEGLSHVAGSQRPYADAAFPAGVGKIYHGGQKLSFDYHYFNVTDEPIQAKAALNMYRVEKSEVQHLAHQFGFYNYAIFIGAGRSSGFEMTCTATADIMVHSLTRHTHKWGTDFTVWASGGADDGKMLWTSADYEADTNFPMPGGPRLLKAGEGYKFRCDYTNTTEELLRFGTKATDEMCILFGTWWKVDERDEVPVGSMNCRFPQ